MNSNIEITIALPAKGLQWFFLYFTALVTNHVNECQQCQNEHSKCHKVFEIKSFLFVFPFIVHWHHLHFMEIEAGTLCGAAVLCPVFYHIFMHTTRGCIKCFMFQLVSGYCSFHAQ